MARGRDFQLIGSKEVNELYQLGVSRDFIGQHYLIGGDWGLESQPHSHHYGLEVRLEGEALDQHGYLADITDVNATLDELAAFYRDRLLNDMPEFSGLNPSIEHFARLLCQSISNMIEAPSITCLTVRLWEDKVAWASYRLER